MNEKKIIICHISEKQLVNNYINKKKNITSQQFSQELKRTFRKEKIQTIWKKVRPQVIKEMQIKQ